MQIVYTKQALKSALKAHKSQGKSIGLVPTMGALHAGHISLVNTAKNTCNIVVASIFVNPTQFNDMSDLENYPRTFDADCNMLEAANCDIVFAPGINEMYNETELSNKQNNIEDNSWMEGKKVDFGHLNEIMEGSHRPGHFNGVAQIVSKLFRVTEPNKAFFGLKDYQQLAVIKSMTKQLNLPVEVIGCPIVRDANGLAMSSRNARLTDNEKLTAAFVSQALLKTKELKTNTTLQDLKRLTLDKIKEEQAIQLEYLELADAETLHPIDDNFDNSKQAVACVAYKLGEVRLIDNVIL